MTRALLAISLAISLAAGAPQKLWAQAQPPTTVPIAIGPKPVFSGTCAVTAASVLGGTWGGSFSTTAACAATAMTVTFPYPMPNGWLCDMHNLTTTADANLVNQTAYTTTTAVFAVTTAAAADIVSYKCTGF